MKEETGRWPRRIWPGKASADRRKSLDDVGAPAPGGSTSVFSTSTAAESSPDTTLHSATHHAKKPSAHAASHSRPSPFGGKLSRTAFAFRGYDVANLGRTAELLAHPAYGEIVRSTLARVSGAASEVLGRDVDLAAYAAAGRETSLAAFAEDVALIVGVELAHMAILEQAFGVDVRQARLMLGYSIGELSANIVGGLYAMEDLLAVPLSLAADCAELAADTSMGVLFTREPVLSETEVARMCRTVSAQGRGLIGASAYLSPNTALILGEGDTLDRLEALIPGRFPGRVMLRRNPNRWPPLHSPIVWRKNIPNRAATEMYKIPGAARPPHPMIVSCVTGRPVDPDSSRDVMIQWTDHPQRLWDAVEMMMTEGVETIVHVGPAPNLIPATFARISNNITKHVKSKHLHRLGNDVVATFSRNAWLAHVLPAKASLLRIPFVEHVVLEDWLLSQPAV